MVVYLLVALFCIALIVTVVGSYLSPRSRAYTEDGVAYAPYPGGGRERGEAGGHKGQYRSNTVGTGPDKGQPYPPRGISRSEAPVRAARGDLSESLQGTRARKERDGQGQAQSLRDGGARRYLDERGEVVPLEERRARYRYLDERGETVPLGRERSRYRYVEERGEAVPLVERRATRRYVEGRGETVPLEGERTRRRYVEERGEAALFGGERSTRRYVDARRPALPLEGVVSTRRGVGEGVVAASDWGQPNLSLRSPVLVGLWGACVPRWLRIPLLFGSIFILCLLLFVQIGGGSSPAMAIINNFVPQPTSVSTNPVVYGENLELSGASKAVVRVGQLDPNQYGSQDEYNQWANSACSAAAMTEIINAYGHNYRITDILKVEAGLHEITPELGLLEAKGISRTMDQFGFKMTPLEHATLDDAIAVANQGHPIIVSFTNSAYWPGGHILVLRGGDAQNVDLADSSRLNLTVVARGRFAQWWNGFTALAVPQ